MSQAIGILELTSIAKGMELGDAMLKSANVDLLVSKTICPGKFLLMLGGDIGAIQQAIETGTSQAGEMLVDSLVLANIHPSVLPSGKILSFTTWRKKRREKISHAIPTSVKTNP